MLLRAGVGHLRLIDFDQVFATPFVNDKSKLIAVCNTLCAYH